MYIKQTICLEGAYRERESRKIFIKRRERKRTLEQDFDRFQTDGKEGIISFLKEEIEIIKREIDEYKKSIKNNLEVL